MIKKDERFEALQRTVDKATRDVEVIIDAHLSTGIYSINFSKILEAITKSIDGGDIKGIKEHVISSIISKAKIAGWTVSRHVGRTMEGGYDYLHFSTGD